jgi:TonB family protein
MASRRLSRRGRETDRVVTRVVLTVLWLAGAPVLRAQVDLTTPGTVVLQSKTATKLLVDQERPEYPTLAKVNYIQGSVRLQVLVDPKGKVREAHVLKGHAFLAAAALKSIRHWVYRPYKTDTGPTDFSTFVDVNFALRIQKVNDLPPEPEDFLSRQVRPPAVLAASPAAPGATTLRLRVLVSAEGSAMDSKLIQGPPSLFGNARRSLERWTFQPARWGNHAVPWYMDVDVPVEGNPTAQTGRGAGSP